MSYYLETAALLLTQLLPVAAGLWRLSWLDASSRIMLGVAAGGLLTEVAGTYAAHYYQNNMLIYNVSSLILMLGVIWYFTSGVLYIGKKHFTVSLIIMTVTIWLISLQFTDTKTSLNMLFQNYEGALTVILSLLSIERLIKVRTLNRLACNPHFWFPLLLLVNWAITLVTWNFYDVFAKYFPNTVAILNVTMVALSMLCNLGFAIVFVKYPRLTYGAQ